MCGSRESKWYKSLNSSTEYKVDKSKKACKYGKKCFKDDCKYEHPEKKKSLEEQVQEINAVKTKASQCKHGNDCFIYSCEFKHETKTGLCPKAEEKLNKLKKQKAKKEKRGAKVDDLLA